MKRKVAIAFMVLLMDEDEPPKKQQRTIWVREWLAKRHQYGCHNTLLEDFRLTDPNSFRRYLRMDEDTYVYLLNIVSPVITKKDTPFRQAIDASHKLSCVLRFYATGESQWSLSGQFRIAQNTISNFMYTVSKAIYEGLRKEYMTCPQTPEQWQAIADGFYTKWNHPNCVGAVDGKHISIVKPPKSGSEFYNYKKFTSTVLMAVIDADMKFIYVDVGSSGKCNDNGIWARSSMQKAIEKNLVKFPENRRVGDFELPYAFVGDEAFTLSTRMMIPFSLQRLNHARRIYNYRHSRARRISENAFGILARVWGCLQKPMNLSLKTVDQVVLALCALQNMLRTRRACRSFIEPPGSVDRENLDGTLTLGDWRENPSHHLTPLSPVAPTAISKQAAQTRDQLVQYFNGVGAVPWQEAMITKNT